MSYEKRTYRSQVNPKRFEYFHSMYLETDLLIGVSKGNHTEEINAFCRIEIEKLRMELDAFISSHPEFSSSYLPLKYKDLVSLNIAALLKASEIADIGPMGGVAGLFSMLVGQKAMKHFKLNEIIVENGGDIYANVKEHLVVSIYAGTSPLSDKLKIRIQPGERGICTSSGTVGHSKSFGKADALTIISESAVYADMLATALANRVQTQHDIEDVLEYSSKFKEIEGILIVQDDKLGIKGNIELC